MVEEEGQNTFGGRGEMGQRTGVGRARDRGAFGREGRRLARRKWLKR